MASLREIRRHIDAVQSLRQMTHALSQVAASRAHKSRLQLREISPYAQGLERVMSLVMLRHGLQHPLLWRRKVQRDVVVVIGSERGLCGTHNVEVARAAEALPLEQGVVRTFFAVGSKLAETLLAHGIVPSRVIPRPRWGYPEEVASLADELTRGYLGDHYQRVILLGFAREDQATKAVVSRVLLPARPAADATLSHLSPEIEPSSIDLMDHVVPRLIRSQLRLAVLHSIALEEEARAVAMQAATRSADELIEEDLRRFRRARQDRITRELLEVVATSDAGEVA